MFAIQVNLDLEKLKDSDEKTKKAKKGPAAAKAEKTDADQDDS